MEYDIENEKELFIDNLKQNNIVEIVLSKTARHNYAQKYILMAFKIKNNDYYLVANLLAFVGAMCIYDKDEMLFLIADDFHKDCFSCQEIL